MTKKQTTIVFLITATIANILLILILLVLFTVAGGLIFKENLGTALPFLFLGAIIAGIFIYQKAVKFVIRKFKTKWSRCFRTTDAGRATENNQ